MRYADYLNRNGSNIGSKVLLVIVGVLNAARNSFSFFLLLIVCMGYGVVKPTLGRTMIYVRWLAIAHFIFGLVYAITSLVITPDSAGKRNSSQPVQSRLILTFYRPVCPAHCLAACRHPDGLLCLDA